MLCWGAVSGATGVRMLRVSHLPIRTAKTGASVLHCTQPGEQLRGAACAAVQAGGAFRGCDRLRETAQSLQRLGSPVPSLRIPARPEADCCDDDARRSTRSNVNMQQRRARASARERAHALDKECGSRLSRRLPACQNLAQREEDASDALVPPLVGLGWLTPD